VIGGEGNGGVIYPRINFARDSLTGMALVLHLLAESQKTVTELLESVPRYSMVKEKMPCPSDKIATVLKMVRQEFAKFQMDTRDGVKVIQPDGWFLVRGSNTEPIIRIVAESKSEEQAKEIVAGLSKRLELNL
jgi:phosphomannomutase